MTRGHNQVEYYSGSDLKESDFRSIDLSLALALIQPGARPQEAHSVTNQLLPYSGVVVTDQRPRLSQIVH